MESKTIPGGERGGDGLVTVRPEQVEDFRRDGFLVMGRVTTDAELEWLRGVYDWLFEQRAGEAGGMFFDLGGPRGHEGQDVLPQVLAPEGHVPELRDTLFHRNARRIAAALLGVDESEVTGGGHMILKPPRYGRETPWHQDEAYWPGEMTYRSVSVWLPLDEASVESGCMHFIPGSHAGPIRRHRHIDDDPTVHGLVTDDLDTGLSIPCPIPAGAATVHHARTLHYAGPNTTDGPRRAYILVMNAPARPAERPEARPWLDEEKHALMGQMGAPVSDTD